MFFQGRLHGRLHGLLKGSLQGVPEIKIQTSAESSDGKEDFVELKIRVHKRGEGEYLMNRQ